MDTEEKNDNSNTSLISAHTVRQTTVLKTLTSSQVGWNTRSALAAASDIHRQLRRDWLTNQDLCFVVNGLVGRQSESPLLQLKIDPVCQMVLPYWLAASGCQRIFINIRGQYGIQKNIYIHPWSETTGDSCNVWAHDQSYGNSVLQGQEKFSAMFCIQLFLIRESYFDQTYRHRLEYDEHHSCDMIQLDRSLPARERHTLVTGLSMRQCFLSSSTNHSGKPSSSPCVYLTVKHMQQKFTTTHFKHALKQTVELFVMEQLRWDF